MKRSVLSIAAIALSASAVQAQTTMGVARPVSFGVSAGATIPTGDIADIASTGFNVNGLIGYQAPAMPIGFRGELMWNRHGLKNGVEGNTQVLGANVNAIYNFPTSSTSGVAPYIIGGVGYSQVKVTLDAANGFDSETADDTGFGLNGGIGVKIPLSGFTTFLEARYHTVFTDGDGNVNFIPVTFGIQF
jgi:opacity protein-like surface antigen